MMAASACALTGCVSPPRGAVCFTFDDYYGENWLKADPLFKKYGAHGYAPTELHLPLRRQVC